MHLYNIENKKQNVNNCNEDGNDYLTAHVRSKDSIENTLSTMILLIPQQIANKMMNRL